MKCLLSRIFDIKKRLFQKVVDDAFFWLLPEMMEGTLLVVFATFAKPHDTLMDFVSFGNTDNVV